MFTKKFYRQKSAYVAGALFIFSLVALILMAADASRLYAADSKWNAKYWNNKTLSGDSVIQRTESKIDHDWGDDSPHEDVDEDNFSARWKRTIEVPAGTYRFTATMDDGMRVWVDDALIIDSWYDSQVHSLSADVYLTSGDHRVKVEYYEAGGGAIAKLSWQAVSGAQPGVISNWRGEYYNNRYLSGSPALVRDDTQINFIWSGNPAPGVNDNEFSVRWTRNVNLAAGRYRFTATADDGVRLWVNNQLLIDQWREQAATPFSAEIDLPGGAIPIKMEYFEGSGGAVAQLSWLRTGGSSAPVTYNNWRGEYFNNTSLSGSPALVRDDPAINFNWIDSSPVPGIVGADNFSVRWTRTLNFNADRYRFTATTDDGVRLWINNQLVINGWTTGALQARSGEITLPGGSATVRMEYFEAGGMAEAHLTWEQISTSPATGGPIGGHMETASVINASYLNVRSGPGTDYSVVNTLSRWTNVSLTGYRNGDISWIQIITPNGRTGWVHANYLWSSYPFSNLTVWNGQTTPPNNGASSSPTARVVNAYYLNVRSGPGTGYGIVTVISGGDTVQLTGYRNAAATWVQIRTARGIQGWVNAGYLSSTYPFSNLVVGG